MENRDLIDAFAAALRDLGDEDDILDAEGAAALLKTSASTVREHARDGVIPAQRLGRGERAPWRFSRRALFEWVRGSSGDSRR